MPWNSLQIRNKNYDFWNVLIPWDKDVQFGHCTSHNFLFDYNEEQRKLYNGQPCIYTDARFVEEHGFSKVFVNRDGSLKACIRIVKRLGNVPIGTKIRFDKRYYDPRGKVDYGYTFIVKKYNEMKFDFEINRPEYFLNFDQGTSNKEKELLKMLRQNGFIVGIYKNYDVLVGNDMGGQIAFGYGHGKIIGFSTGNYTFRGYANGVDNVLWDHFGEFDKWSRCNKIPKTTKNEEIIDILINNKNE